MLENGLQSSYWATPFLSGHPAPRRQNSSCRMTDRGTWQSAYAGTAVMPLLETPGRLDASKSRFDNCPPSRSFLPSVPVGDKASLLLSNFLPCKSLCFSAFCELAVDEMTSVANRLHAGKAVGVDLGINLGVDSFEPALSISAALPSVRVAVFLLPWSELKSGKLATASAKSASIIFELLSVRCLYVPPKALTFGILPTKSPIHKTFAQNQPLTPTNVIKLCQYHEAVPTRKKKKKQKAKSKKMLLLRSNAL